MNDDGGRASADNGPSPLYPIIEQLHFATMIRTGHLYIDLYGENQHDSCQPDHNHICTQLSILSTLRFLLLPLILILLSISSECKQRCPLLRRKSIMSQRQPAHSDSMESPDPEHEAPKKAKSRRPASKTTLSILIQILTLPDTAFRQQRLKAWQ